MFPFLVLDDDFESLACISNYNYCNKINAELIKILIPLARSAYCAPSVIKKLASRHYFEHNYFILLELSIGIVQIPTLKNSGKNGRWTIILD